MTQIMKKIEGRRVISLILAAVMLFSAVQIAGFSPVATASVTSSTVDTRIADPSTMDGWKQFFGPDVLSTENAGGVWTDKSVFKDATAFGGTGITLDGTDNESFLVSLSAIASNQSVTGLSNVPTDTVMILDLSSSMYNGSARTPDTVRTMLNAVNSSIEKLQNLNKHNRVGVVIYFGGENRLQSLSSHSMVMLPLDRYSGSTNYLVANVTSNKLQSIQVNSGLKNSGGATVSQATRRVTDVAGTYAQLGLLDALSQFMAADTIIPATADYQPNVTRVPVIMFMSDGEPTAATHNYTQKVDAGMGNNTISIRNPNETDFVTQLTAAYTRKMVDEHYVETTPLFYSLSLGTSISLEVMDPVNNTNDTIDSYWNSLVNTGYTNITVYNSYNAWSAPTLEVKYTVERTTVPEKGKTVAFPYDVNQRKYVDRAFTASDASQLTDIFDNIVSQISLQSRYYPTLVEGDEDMDGYISFVDKIGEYMEVTDIKGILIDNTLYSGAELASNFVTGGGELGTFDNPTSLGDEMVWAVQARLGIDDVDTARTLLGLAYRNGQLSYVDENNFSNYIGWYANAAGEYLGFWNEGTTTVPEATGNVATDPAYLIKSYGYLGAVDEEQGVAKSDMMYATVHVRESIATGEQSVVFAIPAALIPLVNYEVSLDSQGNFENFKVSGAEHPMHLVYEVALKEEINEVTINDPNVVDPEYVAANKNEDGSVNFYTNQYEADGSVGYGAVNTYSYFRPNRQNSKYYFTEGDMLYTDKNGTKYVGTTKPDVNGEFYCAHEVYVNDNGTLKTAIIYEKLSSAAIEAAEIDTSDNTWHIPIGAVNLNLEGYTIDKTDNATGTLGIANKPFVDVYGHTINDANHRYVVGATLGNNGTLSVNPATGIILSKTVEGSETEDSFEFVITGSSADANKTYSAIIKDSETNADISETSVVFDGNGKATVSLKDGETVYITGMTAGSVYKIQETETVDWTVVSVNGDTSEKDITLTLVDGTFSNAEFVNSQRGSGSLTVTKNVTHNLGSGYVIPEDRTFDITVTLKGVGTGNKTFTAKHSNLSETTSVTTDANGSFTVTLSHNEQVEVLGIPNGTVATVVEATPGEGFTAAYYEGGQLGDGIVTIDGVAAVVVENAYVSKELYPVNIRIGGTKYLETPDGEAADWTDEEFSFTLQQYGANGWEDVDTQTVNSENRSFSFDVSALKYTSPGVYSYQIFEVEPDDADKIDGMFYDNVWHTFSVKVDDADMDGQLEIAEIYSEHADREFELVNGVWTIEVEFTNVQHTTAPALAVIDYQKILNDLSGNPYSNLSGYKLGLYTDENCTESAVTGNGISEIDIVHTDAVGEGWIDIIFDEVGDYTFYVKEINEGAKGMTYSQKVVKVDISVDYGAEGRLTSSVETTLIRNDLGEDVEPVSALNSDGEIEFTNKYDPVDVSVTIIADKTLIGRDMEAGEFGFEIRSEGRTVSVGTNAAAKDGEAAAITFDAITFDKVGVYYYDVAETSVDGNGVTVDKVVHPVIVTVTDNGGELSAGYVVVNVANDDISFVNYYNANPAEYAVSGTKTFNGRTLLNDEFTFLLTEINADGSVPENGAVYTAKNHADGTFSFETIEYTEAGVYYYKVSEKADTVAHGVQFDITEYVVAVTVTDDGLGTLSATATVDGETNKEIAFVNEYVPFAVSVKLHGNKILTGKDLEQGIYTFQLYASDADWNEGELIEEATNGENGHFDFVKLGELNETTGEYEFDTKGDYYYLVKEKGHGSDIQGVLFDSTVYRVHIEIIDDLTGQLQYEVTITDKDGNAFADLTLRNNYRVTEGTKVNIDGTKVLENLELTDEMFNFNLYEADSSFITGGIIQTVPNMGENFGFEIEYTPEDLATKYFYYVVKEENGGETINGITYSSLAYNVKVTLTDNLDGTMSAVVEIAGGDVVFTNIYTPEEPPVTPPDETPDTGDSSDLTRWVVLMVLSGAGFVTALFGKKRKETF